MKNRLLKKLCAVSLSAAMLFGAGAVGAVPFVSTGLSVSAATTADGNFTYEVNEDGGVTITGYNGTNMRVVIPNTVSGKKVTCIGNKAFFNCTSLTSVTIPNSVTSIEERAFSYCERLTSITIPDSVTSIGVAAFIYCKKLTSVTIPDSVTSIGGGAFANCNSLNSVTIPDSVTHMGDEVFSNCTSLTSVTIPNRVTSIGYEMFYQCKSLRSISIPNSVTSIEGDAFYGCYSMTSVIIPDSVTSIGNGAFGYCRSLTSVTIPNRVTSIGNMTFVYCDRLTSITIPNSVKSISDKAFYHCDCLTSITIPDSVKRIGDMAFYACSSKLTIYGKAGSYAETYAQSYGISFEAVTFPLINNSSLSTDSVLLGESVTVNCAASDGEGAYTYAVYYRKAGTTKWTTAQGYKTNATVTFKPKAAVNYEIRVAVKDANGKIARKDMTLVVKKPFTNTSKLNVDTIQLGEKVKVRCFAENGEAPYTFSVQYKKSTSEKWTNVALNSTNNIFVLKPGAAVTYDIRVTAKSADGQASKKILTLTVTK